MSVRGLAQEAVGWYLSHLDDCTPHPDNIKRYFRGPVIALTISILSQDDEAASVPPPLTDEPDNTVIVEKDDKTGQVESTESSSDSQDINNNNNKATPLKRNSVAAAAAAAAASANWKDYLNAHTHTNGGGTNTKVPEFSETQDGADPAGYDNLSERAQARLEAFLLGVSLALPSEADPTQQQQQQQKQQAQQQQQQQQQADQNNTKTNHTNNRSSRTAQRTSSASLKEKRLHLQNPGYASASSSARSFSSTSAPAAAAAATSSDPNNSSKQRRLQLTSSGYASTNSSASSFALIEGLAGFRSLEKGPSSFLMRSMSSSRSLSLPVIKQRPQMLEQDMVTRLELYLRTLLRVRTLHRDCVIAAEPARATKARARAICTSFIDTVSTVRQQGPVLTRLLQTMTKELLAVHLLAEDVLRVISRLVSDYEHTTSFASLAFLSSPENAADEKLLPLVLQYIRYLQVNWQQAVRQCDLERMLSTCLPAALRHTFKTVEFRSIGHLLEVCHAFRAELQHIEFPPALYPGTSSNTIGGSGWSKHKAGGSNSKTTEQQQHVMVSDAAIQQALRDLKREVITVNGHVLPPVTSRSELIQLLQQTLNSRSLAAPLPVRSSKGRGSRRSRRQRSRRGGVARNDSAASGASLSSMDNSFLSSGSDGDFSAHSSPTAPDARGVFRHRSFRLSTVDFLTKRLLIAGSRTGTGGDAYFVVRDLFGGDDVEVVPSTHLPGQTRRETIEILVRLASVTIRCHGSFDVYPKSLVGACEPLIQVHTTTSETISLQEIRATDMNTSNSHSSSTADAGSTEASGIGGGSAAASGHQNDYVRTEDGALMHMVVHERKTEKTGWRTLSVRPALYERVEVWNTPS